MTSLIPEYYGDYCKLILGGMRSCGFEEGEVEHQFEKANEHCQDLGNRPRTFRMISSNKK